MSDKLVLMHLGAQAFFNALIEHGNRLITDTARCNLLLGSRLSLEFKFGGETKLVETGLELLNESVAAAQSGKLTPDDVTFNISQLSRISLRYNSMRTLYHVQAWKDVQCDTPSETLEQLSVDTPADVLPDVIVADTAPVEPPAEVSVPIKKGGRPAKKSV
jgi:hypothetical protein